MIAISFILSYLTTSLFFLFGDLLVDSYRIFLIGTKTNLLKQYITFAPTVFFNILVVTPIVLGILENNFIIIKYNEFSHLNLLFNLIWFYGVFEICFHFIHRLLHIPFLFKIIHFKHHQMKDCIGFGALYCHFLEFLFGNLFPAIIGPILIQEVHYYSLLIWGIITASHTVIAHSGYLIIDKKGAHLIHHRKLNRNYGTIGIFDSLFGTRELIRT